MNEDNDNTTNIGATGSAGYTNDDVESRTEIDGRGFVPDDSASSLTDDSTTRDVLGAEDDIQFIKLNSLSLKSLN